MAKKKTPGIAGQGNFGVYQAMLGFRSSNAAVPFEDARTKRARSRQASNAKAIKDSY